MPGWNCIQHWHQSPSVYMSFESWVCDARLSDAIWQYRPGLTLTEVMTCCLRWSNVDLESLSFSPIKFPRKCTGHNCQILQSILSCQIALYTSDDELWVSKTVCNGAKFFAFFPLRFNTDAHQFVYDMFYIPQALQTADLNTKRSLWHWMADIQGAPDERY